MKYTAALLLTAALTASAFAQESPTLSAERVLLPEVNGTRTITVAQSTSQRVVAWSEYVDGVPRIRVAPLGDGPIERALVRDVPLQAATPPADVAHPSLATDGSDFLIVWAERHFDAVVIPLMRLDEQGRPAWPTPVVVGRAPLATTIAPKIAWSGDSYVATWGSGSARIDRTGAIAQPNNVLLAPGGSITGLTAGRHGIAYTTATNSTTRECNGGLSPWSFTCRDVVSYGYAVRVQRGDTTLTPINQMGGALPRVATAAGDEGFLAVLAEPAPTRVMHALPIAANGTAGAFKRIADVRLLLEPPVVAAAGDYYAIFWHDADPSLHGLWTSLVRADGTPILGPTRLATELAVFPAIAAAGAGNGRFTLAYTRRAANGATSLVTRELSAFAPYARPVRRR